MTDEEKTDEVDSGELASAKVVILGETATGKSCMIARFVSDKFVENFVPTMGGCFSTKDVKIDELNKTIRFEIWDTAGQEKYRTINKIYYQDAAAAILVYDITRKDTFEEVKNYWFNEVKYNSNPKIVIALAGNKSDLYEYEDIKLKKAQKFADENDLIFKSTSSLNGNGISDLFKNIAIKIFDKDHYEELVGSKKKRKKEGIQIKKKDFVEEKKVQNNSDSTGTSSSNNNKKKKGCC